MDQPLQRQPTQSQMDHVKVLDKEPTAADSAFGRMAGKALGPLSDPLKGKNFALLTVLI